LSISRRFLIRWGMKYLTEIVLIFVPECPVFIIITTTTTISTIYICTCLTIIRITTITLIRPMRVGW
jgi:hypothetical protein